MQDFNYHTHTYRCGHADNNVSDEDYVKEAIKQGIKKIAFTDHCPQREKIDLRSNMRMDYSEKEEYYRSIRDLKEKYKDMIDIEVGFEVEYLPGLENYLRELKSEVDKIVLGQHFVYGDDNKSLRIIGRCIPNKGDLIKYGNYIARAIEEGLVDIVAHPDLFMYGDDRFGEEEKEATHIICKAAEKYGVPLEINLNRATNVLIGRRSKVEYPNKDFWKIASNYNIKVVYGIDAHIKEAITLYKECIELVNEVLGKEIVSKLNFVDENLEILEK